MGKIVNSEFQAALWLKSPHLQTLYPTLFRSKPAVAFEQERVELDDGDFLDLIWHKRADSPVVLLIHGLEGCIGSHYAGNMLVALHQAGFSAVLLHLRGCGYEANRLPETYHSGKTGDLRLIIDYLQDTDRLPVAAVGISLGGNLLLKYLGEAQGNSPLQTGIAISVPFQLKACGSKLERGFSRIYSHYLLNRIKRSYQNKFSNPHEKISPRKHRSRFADSHRKIPSPLTVDLRKIKTLWEVDNVITAPLNGFAGADDYYQQCSSFGFLSAIRTPTLILHAADDPFVPEDCIPSDRDMSDYVTLELSGAGGHVGFIRSLDGKLDYWLESRVCDYLQSFKPLLSGSIGDEKAA